MLQTLNIKNVALIKNLTLDFSDGFNVLLGETGAGKSIIFDALNFVLGGKANKELVRSGENMMKVDALFCGLSKQALDALNELDISCEEDEILLSRSFSLDGKSTIRINGEPSIALTLKKVGQILVDSYSQHESVDLMQDKNHLALLDRFGGQALRELKDEVKTRYERYQSTLKQIDMLGGDSFERERTKSLLEYQVSEIEDANLHEGEEEEVKSRLAVLANGEKIAEALSLCSGLLDQGSSSVLASIQEVLGALERINGVSEIDGYVERLKSCKYELQDISEGLANFGENLNFDSFELERLDKRNDLIKAMLKKYGNSITEVLQYLAVSKERLMRLSDADAELEKLEKLKAEQENALSQACDSLTSRRKEIAKIVENKVVKELADLNMKNTTFVINFNKLTTFSANGNDDVYFTFSANKGQEVKALSKTASGGEISRFMLAIKNIFAEFGSAQTLIFDEIDSGISGETGVVVGDKIARLAKHNQVICITHLPQVACRGDNFFYVSKAVENDNTVTSVKNLDEQEIIFQIARMIGGDDVTQTALNHSKELRAKK